MTSTSDKIGQLRDDLEEAFPRRDGEPFPLWLRKAFNEGHLCRQDVDDMLAHFDAEIGPMPSDEGDEESFAIANARPNRKPWRPENEPARQRALFSGLDCLPGQGDLFDC